MTSMMTSSRIIIVGTSGLNISETRPDSGMVLVSLNRCALLRYLQRLILASERTMSPTGLCVILLVLLPCYSNIIFMPLPHIVAPGIMFLDCSRVHLSRALLTQYLENYWTDFQQAYSNDASWDRDEPSDYFGVKGPEFKVTFEDRHTEGLLDVSRQVQSF